MTAGFSAAWADHMQRVLVTAGATTAPFGARVHVFETVTSTNDVAAQLAADDAPEGTLVVAAHQSQGRGRRGTTFVSPAGGGLYLSTILRPSSWPTAMTDAIGVAGAITLMAGLAAVRTARELGAGAAELKWPNDVVVAAPDGGWRKLAGILTEASSNAAGALVVVVGVGMNVIEAPAGPRLPDVATSLSTVSEQPVRVDETAVALMTCFAYAWRVLAFEGRQAIVDAWRRHAPSLQGRAVSWMEGTRQRSGRAVGVDDRGALRVETAEGLTTLVAGHVDWDAADVRP